jgi:DNA-binding NarL/FixJ family response regulator
VVTAGQAVHATQEAVAHELIYFPAVQAADSALRVVLVDDHQFFRDGLSRLLAAAGIAVVGETGDGARAPALVRELAPDATVIDLKLPNESGVQAIREIRAEDPGARLLALTVSADPHDVIEALAAGACGYLVKDTHPDDVARGIWLVSKGHAVLSGDVARELARSYRNSVRLAAAHDGLALTAREREVLRLIAEGADNAAIGRALSISGHTVKQHVTNILQKLGVHSRVQAAVYAVRHRLV